MPENQEQRQFLKVSMSSKKEKPRFLHRGSSGLGKVYFKKAQLQAYLYGQSGTACLKVSREFCDPELQAHKQW